MESSLSPPLPGSQGSQISPPPGSQALLTPPQVFGAFAPDGSPLPPPSFNDPIFAIDQMRLMAEESMNDAKRRRIARACDTCRSKKIRCSGDFPCEFCDHSGRECKFTYVEKKRSAPRGAKYVEGLEKRLKRMESLLKLSGVLTDDDFSKTDLATLEKQLASRAKKNRSQTSKSPASSRRASVAAAESESEAEDVGTSRKTSALASPAVRSPSPETEKRAQDEVEALSEMMCSLVTNNSGETRYIGSSSGFSIFSPRGIQWVNEKTGDTSFQETISAAVEDDNKWVHWKPDVFADLFQRRIFKPLPSKEEALSLLKDYFENFNCMFPLFHEPTFLHLVELQYSSQPYLGSGWWASLNVALAIAHRLRVMSNVVPQDEDQKGWAYLKNAMGVLTELTMRNTDLLSVQALLGMSLFLQGTPNPQPSFFLVAAAIRLAHSIGLHKRGSGFNLRADEIEQRKRVFWIAYLVDKDLCLRSGRPPAQDDDDMNVELPSEDPPDNIGNIPFADGNGKINLFRLMCTFAVIESKVYKQLYSTKASRQSDGELLTTIGELDRELEEWKDGIPIDFRPEHEIKASHTPLMLHIVVLHFAYYNCLTTIHRMSIHHGYWTSRLSNFALQGLNTRPLNPRVFSSATVCVSAARMSINLLQYIPQGDFACVWLILYFPVSALVTLFANVLQNPQDAKARADARLMNRVVSFLSMLSNDDDGTGGVRRMLGVCAEFERIANVVLDRAEHESGSGRKRKTTDAGTVKNHRRTPSGKVHALPGEILTPEHFQHPITPRQSVDLGHPPAPTSPTPAARPDVVPRNLNVPPVAEQFPIDVTPPWGSSGFTPPTTATTTTTDGSTGPAANLLTPPSVQTPGLPDSQAEQQQQQQPLAFDSVFDLDAFQQPFLPQHLWQMPMTLEWDWADMTSFGGPTTFQAGGGGDGGGGDGGGGGGHAYEGGGHGGHGLG